MRPAAPGLLDGIAPSRELGDELHALAARLYPINRSITGQGVRDTLAILGSYADIATHEIPTGTEVFDWTIPREWTLREAWIADSTGRRIVDVARHALHVVGYSTPVRARMSLEELRPHLHTLPGAPSLIPYRTSYYDATWGFCLPHDVLATLPDGDYDVLIDASLADGNLTYGEVVIPGASHDEILLTAHVCHPSLANDNCSGLALLALLARHLAQEPRRLTYRILFAPGTIGAIAWLARNRERVARIRHGLVISNVGDGGGPTYKRSRRGSAEIDRAAALVLRDARLPGTSIRDFTPYGYDERQFCSPGFDLPVGAFQCSSWGEFPEYHTSADNLDLVRPEHLDRSFRLVLAMLDVLERNGTYRNLSPFCEPQLGRRGLLGPAGGDGSGMPDRMAMLWALNLSDGRSDLLAIAERSKLPFCQIATAARHLEAAGLLASTEAGA